jgi:2-polyprenyl-3-methyl-5-hydroxy-6-metoxy-1,4-benzoquinol methylase
LTSPADGVENSLRSLYEKKSDDYSSRARLELIELFPQYADRMLEVGSANGATSRAVKAAGKAGHISAIDIVHPHPENLGVAGIDHFTLANVEATDPKALGGPFDLILCGDVLEHLVDPWATVRRLTGALRPGGIFIASLPNVRNHRVLASIILKGRFRYEKAGILDESHLRFFCRRDVVGLFEQSGLTIESIGTNMGGFGFRNRIFVWLSLGGLRDFFVFQFLVRCRKPTE